MKVVALKVSDSKLAFFMELVKQLGFEVVSEDVTIPQWQQDLALKRLKELDKNTSKEADFDKMIDKLEQKHGL